MHVEKVWHTTAFVCSDVEIHCSYGFLLTKSTNALIHQNYILLYLLWYIQKTYILINHELTQEIYIILANIVVFWS